MRASRSSITFFTSGLRTNVKVNNLAQSGLRTKAKVDSGLRTKAKVDNLAASRSSITFFTSGLRTKPKVDILVRTKAKADNLVRTKAQVDNLVRTKAKVDNLVRTKAKVNNSAQKSTVLVRKWTFSAKVDGLMQTSRPSITWLTSGCKRKPNVDNLVPAGKAKCTLWCKRGRFGAKVVGRRSHSI